MPIKKLLILLATVGILFSLAPARAEDMEALMSRLDRMERDMQDLQKDLYRDGGKAASKGASSGAANSDMNASAVSRIESRLDDLENNMRQLTGRIEEATHQNQQTQKQLEKYMADAELRFQTLEQFKTQMTPVTPPPGAQTLPANPTSQTTIPPQPIVPGKPAATTAPVTPPAPTPPVGTAQENYDAALALLHQTDYAGAEAKFKDFLKAFPQDTLAGNAQYWLAETYYVRGSYNDSAVEFLKSYQSYPKSNKAPDSLLKLGLSLSQLNNKAEACTTLKKLDKEYPKAVAAIKKRAVDEMSKLKCG
jgi:tol-pal system protein YbgF